MFIATLQQKDIRFLRSCHVQKSAMLKLPTFFQVVVKQEQTKQRQRVITTGSQATRSVSEYMTT